MKIKYYPVESTMAGSGKFRGQVAGFVSVSEKEIIKHVTRPGSTITVAEAKANYEELISAYEYFLRQGYGINTGFMNIRPVITGLFEGKEDRFDSSRHKVRFRASLGKRYNRTSDDVKTEKIEATNLPSPVQLEDVVSKTVNSILSPDGVALLSGKRLLFSQDDPQQGIFLIDAAGTPERAVRILSQKRSHVIFMVPEDLAAGDYSLEVRMRRKNSKTLKTGALPDKLTVGA